MYLPIQTNDIITASGKYPDRHKLMTPEKTEETKELARRMTNFFRAVGYDITKIKFSSGIRNTNPNSAHDKGMAADVVDLKGEIFKLCWDNYDLLVENGLWIEHRNWTPTWCHFQTREVVRRFFVPNSTPALINEYPIKHPKGV